MKKLLDNGTLVTLGLVGVVAAVGAANKAGLYGSRALLSTSGLSKLTDAELEDYWESLSPSMRNTEAWHLAVTERNVREYRLPNGPAYAAFKASRRSRGSRAHAFPLLHRPIRSQADAEAYLRELMSSGHSYHLEDDASDIVRTSTGEPLFTAEQARLANQRAKEVFTHFTRGDPFEYMFDLLES